MELSLSGHSVKELSEMRDEMRTAGLDAPRYKVDDSHTIVTLFNNAQQREALLRTASIGQNFKLSFY